jgi:chain length determinant protein tyrosine kinase EpsG
MNDLAKPIPLQPQIIPKPVNKMGRMLLESGKLSLEDLKAIITYQERHGLRFGDAAQQLGLLTAEDINSALADQFSYTRTPDRTSKLDKRLLAAFQPDGVHAEALRSLRSELLLRYFNQGENLSLALIGAEDAEGIALTAANLAVVFSQLGLRTLLIDSNLREPQLHSVFGLNDRNLGLADLLAGRAFSAPIEIPELRSLWVIPAGTQAPNPQELLTGKLFSTQMQELAASFDVTLISTPPMRENRDAQLVAADIGAALLVVQEHNSRYKDLSSICSGLRELGVRLLGAALKQ